LERQKALRSFRVHGRLIVERRRIGERIEVKAPSGNAPESHPITRCFPHE